MLIIKPSYSLVIAINCQSDMIKTRLYNTNMPYSYKNDQRSPGKMILIVISPEIYSYVRSHVNSRSLEDIQNEYFCLTYKARESNDCVVKVDKSIK